MNYEELYQRISVLEKGVKEKQSAGLRSFKKLCGYSDKGDLKNYAKELAQLQSSVTEQAELLAQLLDAAQGFDTAAYVDSGDFAEQLLYECRSRSVDVNGKFPIYEIFPYQVKIDTDNQEILVNNKRWPGLRPLSFAVDIKAARDKLMRTSFKADTFINELCAAYDILVMVKNKELEDAPDDIFVSLKDLYKYLTPTQRARKAYDARDYAYDLARLFSSEVRQVKDGRTLDFGTRKNAKGVIRILDTDGHEHLLTTIRFF